MRILRSAIVGILSLFAVASASAQQFPTVPDHSVVGRIGVGGKSGPSQAIPFSVLLPNVFGTQTANTVYAGPSSGGVAQPTFRALVGADLPAPGASSFGGVQSKTCSSSNWFSSLSSGGVFGCSQPAFSDITGSVAAGQLPNPSASTLGGVKSLAAISHQFLTSISTAGQPTQAQPACADVSDATVYCNAARGQLPGTTTNDNASAGNLAEYPESVIPVGSAVSLTTNTAKDVTTISLTAGDWEVSGSCSFVLASTTSISGVACSVSQTLNTTDATNGRQTTLAFPAFVPTAGTDFAIGTIPLRFSLSGTTTLHLVSFATFTVSTTTTFGIIRARRAR